MTDRQQYEDLLSQLRLTPIESKAHQEVWAKIEKLKNQHGGLPPAKETP